MEIQSDLMEADYIQCTALANSVSNVVANLWKEDIMLIINSNILCSLSATNLDLHAWNLILFME